MSLSTQFQSYGKFTVTNTSIYQGFRTLRFHSICLNGLVSIALGTNSLGTSSKLVYQVFSFLFFPLLILFFLLFPFFSSFISFFFPLPIIYLVYISLWYTTEYTWVWFWMWPKTPLYFYFLGTTLPGIIFPR